MLIFILKFSACLLVFLVFYNLILERERMHHFKRAYLLLSLIASATIPLVTFTTIIEQQPLALPSGINPIEINAALQEESINLWDYVTQALWIIYGFGLVVFSGKFIMNLFQIQHKIKRNQKHHYDGFINVLLKGLKVPHTFFRYIFLNKEEYENNEIPEAILLHEQAHARQKHSLDILFVELLQIILWFNPLIYITKRNIKSNHEYLADEAVLKQGISMPLYQDIILNFSTAQNQAALAHAFNYSSIKKRFTVMKVQTSKTKIWLRTFLLLPMISILFYSFAERKEVIKENAAEPNLFLITAEKKGNTIELKCEDGCNWSNITIDNKKAYVINDYGFSQGNTVDTDKFAFTIEHNESGVLLNGLKGTAWIDLNFSLGQNKKQFINQLGMMNSSSIASKDAEVNGKTLKIQAVKDQLTLNGKLISVNNYKDNLNAITKNWSREDYKSVSPLLEISECSQDFLDELDSQFRTSDYFLVTIQGSPITVNKIIDRNALENGLFINGEPCHKCTIELSKEEIKMLTFTGTRSEEINTFKVKFPGNPTYVNKGGILNPKVFSMLDKALVGDHISLFDFYTKEGAIESSLAMIKIIKAKQDGATPKQIAEYNKLAEHYSNMPKDNMIVKHKDLEKMKYIYGIMTDKQKQNAIPFPKIKLPPPPPPATPVKAEAVMLEKKEGIKLKKQAEGVKLKKLKEKKEKAVRLKKLAKPVAIEVVEVPPPPPPVPANATPKQKEKYKKAILEYEKKYAEKAKLKAKSKKALKEVPPPPPPKSLLKFIDEMDTEGAKFYLNGKSITADEARKMMAKKKKGQKVDVHSYKDKSDRFIVKFKMENETDAKRTKQQASINTEQSPWKVDVKTESVVDLTEMIKNNAKFYYNDKEISFEEASKIVKTKSSLKVETKDMESKQPKVYFWDA